MGNKTSICARVALMAILGVGYCHSAGEAGFLQQRVCRFIFHGRSGRTREHNRTTWAAGISLAAHFLALHAEVPICIEELPSLPGEPIVPVEINANDTTVKDILDDMILQDPRYIYRERLGVIELLPYGADRDPTNCLNMVIPLFKPRNEWNSLIQSLRCEIDIVSRNPKAVVPDPWVAGGCGGSFPGLPNPPSGLIEAGFENETVRDILDRLCAKVGNMAWSAEFEAPRVSCEDLSISVYQPRSSYPSDTSPVTWSEGLPKKCTGCHYHKPGPAN